MNLLKTFGEEHQRLPKFEKKSNMENTKENPKALNLSGIDLNGKKATIGFKCDPSVKYNLAKRSESLGLTLSSYVENLITFSIKEKDEILTKNQAQLVTINELKKKLKHYEELPIPEPLLKNDVRNNNSTNSTEQQSSFGIAFWSFFVGK